MDENLMKDIIKTTDIIKKKYRTLKRGKIDTDTQLEETFKPITKPLKELAEKVDFVSKDFLKSEIKDELEPKLEPKFKHPKTELTSTPLKHELETSKEISETSDNDGDDEYETYQSHNLFDDYIKKHKSLKFENLFDTIYGVYYDKNTQEWKIGNSKISNDDGDSNNIKIAEKSYIGTPGLYELLFMKKPKRHIYTKDDLANYYTILKSTNAHKRGYKQDGQINGNRSYKYRTIIHNLIHHQGSGLMYMQLPKKQIDYVYWDNPNELVDRLKLLIASHQAGHNNHHNEIISIIEELKEADII